jgi:hypothetical protein
MRLGMMQPYFFPYVGYFSLIHATDFWIVFDTAQYIRRGWVNRNRVLSNGSEPWKYVRVPVQHASQETPICEIAVDDSLKWADELLRNLDAYIQRRAPFYEPVSQWLRDLLTVELFPVEQHSVGSDRLLSPLLIRLLEAVCRYICLPFRYEVFSGMQLQLPEITAPGQWALEVARATGASRYINAPGGRDIFSSEDFSAAGVELRFLEPQLTSYSQRGASFVPGLSIIDLLMWNSPQRVLEMTAEYELSHA